MKLHEYQEEFKTIKSHSLIYIIISSYAFHSSTFCIFRHFCFAFFCMFILYFSALLFCFFLHVYFAFFGTFTFFSTFYFSSHHHLQIIFSQRKKSKDLFSLYSIPIVPTSHYCSFLNLRMNPLVILPLHSPQSGNQSRFPVVH